jgi:hypothetical protein
VEGGPIYSISSLDTRFATDRSHAFGADAAVFFYGVPFPIYFNQMIRGQLMICRNFYDF